MAGGAALHPDARPGQGRPVPLRRHRRAEHRTPRTSRKLGGLIRTMPVTAIAFLLCAFSVMGIPPFGGFFSKYMVHQRRGRRAGSSWIGAGVPGRRVPDDPLPVPRCSTWSSWASRRRQPVAGGLAGDGGMRRAAGGAVARRAGSLINCPSRVRRSRPVTQMLGVVTMNDMTLLLLADRSCRSSPALLALLLPQASARRGATADRCCSPRRANLALCRLRSFGERLIAFALPWAGFGIEFALRLYHFSALHPARRSAGFAFLVVALLAARSCEAQARAQPVLRVPAAHAGDGQRRGPGRQPGRCCSSSGKGCC